MTLKAQIWDVWSRYKNHFGPYCERAGLKLGTATEDNLLYVLREKIKVNYQLDGLEEFYRARDGYCRGIEPGDPARSLIYHIFASPHVHPEELDNDNYPKMADLEVIENCVYAAAFPTLNELLKCAEDQPVAIVVFAYEYAPAADTVHRRHADLCFSRTGISRVGNVPPRYIGRARGFFPFSSEKKKVHVVPARFGAFIAVQRQGNKDTIGPMRFSPGDEKRKFWVPLHKLFNGPECIDGQNLDLTIEVHHVNEKIKRLHVALQNEGHDTGWNASQMRFPPFRIEDCLAEFSATEGLVIPEPHDPLVAPAQTEDGKLVGFPVPPDHDLLGASLWLHDYFGAIPRPEFVHIKHEIKNIGGRQTIVYLPGMQNLDIVAKAKHGNYEAANFVDFTADGWVQASCPALAQANLKNHAAYSIIAQPDFFPLVRQQDLIEWWEQEVPKEIKNSIWADTDARPAPLSGSRLPANITLVEAGFDSAETAMSAIVSVDRGNRGTGPQGKVIRDLPRRESTLSYRATNLFQPGWDSSQDFNRDAKRKRGTFHLANYGLGSPYPEDTLICAALGSFWPGAVPDITRSFAMGFYPSVTPIVDDEASWDGIPRPRIDGVDAEYPTLAYQDYVEAIYFKQFPYGTFAEVTLEDYIRRTLASARVFQILAVSKSRSRAKYLFLSFRNPTEDELKQIQRYGWQVAQDLTYRIEIARFIPSVTKPNNPPVKSVRLRDRRVFYSSEYAIAYEDPNNQGGWIVKEFEENN